MLVRVKEFELDGTKIKLGALTTSQVERLFTKVPDDATAQTLTQRMREVIATSLNNAINGSGEPQWTIERIPEEMDQVFTQALWRTVVEWTGFAVVPVGEAKAAEN